MNSSSRNRSWKSWTRFIAPTGFFIIGSTVVAVVILSWLWQETLR